ncbi:MAG: methyltransferase [Tannerellaceae bacterium]|jgi:tRNA1Val (adenine37-N6)-methyltransferase|nr:methyltransferase [Tannerellaceae bacterium]
MENEGFRFKQFTVNHNKCGMKVGVDGVLLGAWASVDGCRRVLDLGTGSGLIALMAAQRNCSTVVDGIDIDVDACRQARENVAASPFAGRIYVIRTSLREYMPGRHGLYDLIVSNPPYFLMSLKGRDSSRTMARNSDSLPLYDIVTCGSKLLRKDGRIALILPFDRLKDLKTVAEIGEMYIVRMTVVETVKGNEPKRVMVELSTACSGPYTEEKLVIEDARGVYSPAYIGLTKDFYLNF